VRRAHPKAALEEPRTGDHNQAKLKALNVLYPYSSTPSSELVTSAMYAIVVRPTGLRGRSRGSGALVVPSCGRRTVHGC
jgi:hypothetical protein